MNKSALRQHYLAQRRSLTAEDIVHRSEQIASQFFNNILTQSSIKTLHTFLPIARQNEVDTWPIIRRIWQDFPLIQIAVSVTDTTSNQLDHYILSPDTPLVENRWGIPEPKPGSSTVIGSNHLDLVLVPLLTFDKQGHRVGYGKGYYDRFMAECRTGCLKVGLSLFDPVERINDITPKDIRLDTYISPNQVWQFQH